MLTVDFDRLAVGPGTTVLDLGCGGGRHAFEALRRGARVIAADIDAAALCGVDDMAAAMTSAGEPAPGGELTTVQADALSLPWADAEFDVVIASEVLEHIRDDRRAMAEIRRVLRPGGLAAVTVPRYWPERVCWALSSEYHQVSGGHVRIYRGDELGRRLQEAGLQLFGRAHAHALHAPYWWLKCAIGVRNDGAPLPRAYHRFLVWDLMRRPRATRVLEAALNPVLGKSLVLYLRRPAEDALAAA
jgi:SAM-dependent methyltransferase